MRTVKRPGWYTKPAPVRNRSWQYEERLFLYDLRVFKKKSVDDIIEAFEKKYGDKLTKNQVNNQNRMMKRMMKGKCFECQKKLTLKDLQSRKKGKIPRLCLKCRKKARLSKKRRRDHALANGLCGVCYKRVLVPGKTACKKCLSATHRRRITVARCGSCGKPIDTSRSTALCTTCLDKNAIYSVSSRS